MPVLRCKTSFHAIGRPVMVQRGQLFDSSDPVIKGRESMFVNVDDVVEQATAAPGERRSVIRKKAAKRAETSEPGPVAD